MNMTKDVTKQIAALSTQMNRRFDRVDERFGTMEKRIGGVELKLGERINSVELKLDLYKEQYFAPALQALGEGFASVNERLDRAVAGSQERSERIERGYTPIGTHQALDRRVTKLEKSGRA